MLTKEDFRQNLHTIDVCCKLGMLPIKLEMSARTGSSQMPTPVSVPAGTGQPERRGQCIGWARRARRGTQARAAGTC